MQGSAADLAKQAMIRLHSVFQQWHQQHPQLPQGTGRRPHLLVQIHDELLFEVGCPHMLPLAALLLANKHEKHESRLLHDIYPAAICCRLLCVTQHEHRPGPAQTCVC